MLNDTLYNSAKILPFLIFTLYFVFNIYFILGIAFIFLYIGLTFFTKYFDFKQVQIRKKKHLLKKENSRTVAKIIMSKYEILQSSKVAFEVEKISNTYDAIIENNKEQNFWGHILFRGSEVILFSSKVVLLIFIGREYFEGSISLTYVVTFITVITYFEKNAQDFLIFYKNFTRDIHEMTGLWDFFDTTPHIQGYEE
jgi:ABC-type bacteriocin/lantibiotic exporter with double-glycine peptidase domain